MNLRTIAFLAIAVVASSSFSFAEAPESLEQWVAQVQAHRMEAEILIEQGNLRSAADLLAASWRDLPEAWPELADTATASMQLLLFIMEYLMDETTVSQFVRESLNPEASDSDKFIRTVYDIAIGQETPGKTQAAIEMTYLTESKNPFVRIGALFMLSDPYYFSDSKFVEGMSGTLVRDFPDLTITQEALRLTVYEVARDEPDIIEQALPLEPADPAVDQKDLSLSAMPEQTASPATLLENDAVVECLREVLPDLGANPALAVQKTCETAVSAAGWRTRYGCLVIAERTAKKAGLAIPEAAISALANRTDPTPEVAHARVLAGDRFRNSYSSKAGQALLDKAVQDTIQLLSTAWTAHPYERNLYEENLKEVQNMADWMAKNGHSSEAVELYKAMMAKYPNSIVSSACANKLQGLGTE